MDGETLVARSARPEPQADAGARMEGWFRAFLREVERAGLDQAPTLRAWVELAEAWRILQALREAGGNRSAAMGARGRSGH